MLHVLDMLRYLYFKLVENTCQHHKGKHCFCFKGIPSVVTLARVKANFFLSLNRCLALARVP